MYNINDYFFEVTNMITLTEQFEAKDSFDVIVAGAGVAGVSAAVAAARCGKRVMLIEKNVILGGLATSGLIDLFVPMCNGRGVKIIKGMCDEFVRTAIKYGYDTIPDDWKSGGDTADTNERYHTHYSPSIFALALAKLLDDEGVELFYDTVVSSPVMEGGHCKGLILESKSGREYYEGKIIIDTTSDADILYRAGVPTVDGKNFFSYVAYGTTLETCKRAADEKNIGALQFWTMGGEATLYGTNQREGERLYKGTTKEDVTEYVVRNQLALLEKVAKKDRNSYDITILPTMPQFRTTRRLDGDYTLTVDDAYRHFDDSVAAVCDFDRRDYLFEIPYRTLVRKGYDNLITAGRSASGEGYAWDVIRVIPPAILTGQAAGNAAAMALEYGCSICDIDVAALQNKLEEQNVMIHFDDALVPGEEREDAHEDIGHI